MEKDALEELEEKFTKYEVARILGARALQIAMDAPILLKMSDEELEEINYNPIEIAKRELLSEVLPITVNRPMPKKREDKIKVLSRKEVEELKKLDEEKVKQEEEKAEKEIEKETGKEAPSRAADIKASEELEKKVELEEEKVAEDSEIMALAKPEDEADTELQETPKGEEEI